MNLNGTLQFAVTGTSSTGLSVNINPVVKVSSTTLEDYLHNTYTINPVTTAREVDLGTLATGKYLFINTNGLVQVTLTQNAADIVFSVTGAFYFTGEFTALKLANTSTTEVREVTVLAVGNRAV